MKITISKNLREESTIILFSVKCEDYKHTISIYLDNLTQDDIFLYIYESKYIYNGKCHVFKNSTSTALTNAISSDFDHAYGISDYHSLISYFKSKYEHDEHAYSKIVEDIKSKGIGVDEDVDNREEDNYDYLKRYF